MSKLFLIISLTMCYTANTIVTASYEYVCPSGISFSPCTCEVEEEGLSIACRNINDPFDIKAYFDRLTIALGNLRSFYGLHIKNTSILKIPANTLPTLQFFEISIEGNPNLEYISSEAFSVTYKVTEGVRIAGNPKLHNNPPKEWNVFDFINKFEIIGKVSVIGNGITSIPGKALQNVNLHVLEIVDNPNLVSIGASAFDKLPKLILLYLSGNAFKSENISQDAFKLINSARYIDLRRTPSLDFMDEKIFSTLLDRVSSVHSDAMYCDSRADWICKTPVNIEKIVGFQCIGNIHFRISDYCNGAKMTTPTTTINETSTIAGATGFIASIKIVTIVFFVTIQLLKAVLNS